MLLVGCARFQTARECESFARAINAWKGQAPQPAASAGAASPAAAAEESRRLADRYEDLAKRIDALHLESTELVPRAERYQRLAREAAAALRDVAESAEKGEAEAARRRRVEFDDLAGGEAPLVAEINGICR